MFVQVWRILSDKIINEKKSKIYNGFFDYVWSIVLIESILSQQPFYVFSEFSDRY